MKKNLRVTSGRLGQSTRSSSSKIMSFLHGGAALFSLQMTVKRSSDTIDCDIEGFLFPQEHS